MKSLFQLVIVQDIALEEAWDTLEANGVEILYGSEEDGQAVVFALLKDSSEVDSLLCISSCIPHELPQIDWAAQWAAHGQDFHDGYVHVDLTQYRGGAPLLKLEPGPGFGDLSHPTTRLTLQLLGKKLNKQSVIDIGCGSGVLSLAAAALGAETVYGVDIDSAALIHSRKNAILNQLEEKCHFCLPSDFSGLSNTPLMILMNMIQSEQQTAWNSLPMLHHHQPLVCITSGIPIEDREHYLKLTQTWQWFLEEEIEEDGWIVFYFTKINV
jgi:ribosomal protein L11 methyltransferase